MKIGVALRSALEALAANPLRSFLTMLGIMIGVASVMAMMAISEGAARQVDEQISALGTNNLSVRPGSQRIRGRSGGSFAPFTERDIETLREESFIRAIAAYNQGQGTAVAGEANWSTNIYGTNTDYFAVQSWAVIEGRIFDTREVQSGAAVVVIGQTVADNLFEGTNPIGQRMRVDNVPLTVVGLLESKGQTTRGDDRDDVVITPISTARNRILGAWPTVARHVVSMTVQVDPSFDVAEAQVLLEERMREIRKIRPGESDNFRVFNIADFVRARSETQQTFGVLLAFTAAVSLLVGGVGVMNIMLVSVTERTREIGLRMAVGARGGDILGQFLIEALALCLIGGLIGSGLGYGAAQLAARLGDFPVTVSPQIALIALGASAVVGLFFGFFPARRAAKLNPIEALRHE